MAIMHPKYVYHFNSLSEQRLYNALKNQLPNNYEVFYSVVWYSKDEDNNRINSESDFVIVDQKRDSYVLKLRAELSMFINMTNTLFIIQMEKIL